MSKIYYETNGGQDRFSETCNSLPESRQKNSIQRRYCWLRQKPTHGSSRTALALVILSILAVTITACSSTKNTNNPHHGISGHVDVAYAGSLERVNDTTLGPAFTDKTHIAYQGRGGGSFGLAHEIMASEIQPGVFESVGSGPIKLLEPKFTSFYVQFMASPLVIAYNPHSRYASLFSRVQQGKASLKQLFEAMTSPGFRLGRTNPATDPQGQAFVMMVHLAVAYLHLPSGTARRILGGTGLGAPSQIFSETSLDAHLQAGQLDAASAFLSQAVQYHLPYVALPAAINFGDPAYSSSYAAASLLLPGGKVVHGTPLTVDITAIRENHVPLSSSTKGYSKQAISFISFVLSPRGRAIYKNAGYELLKEQVVGNPASVPSIVEKTVENSKISQ